MKGSCYKIYALRGKRKYVEVGISKSLEDAEKYIDYLIKHKLEKEDSLDISKVNFV